MKILLIETLGDGGIAHYTYNLAKALVKNNNSVHLFTSAKYEFENRNESFKVFPRMFGFTEYLIRFIPYLKGAKPLPSLLRRMLKLLEYPLNSLQALKLAVEHEIQIIHFQSVNWIELLMVVLFKLGGFKIIYTIHNIVPHHKKLRLYHVIIYKILYGLCHRLIIHSEKGKEEVIGIFGVAREKIFVIPHGDYKFFIPKKELTKKEAKEILKIPLHCRTLLFFGAIRPNKGLDQAIDILDQVTKYITNIRLMIVGELWENFDRYEKQIKKYNIQNNIYTHLQYVTNEELPKYFIASDIVLLPYYEITGSGVLQIAYAFSKPVVATDLDCFREVIDDGKNGYLVSKKDHVQFAERIVEILNDDTKKKYMGQHSRLLADTRYSWDTISKETIQVYAI